MSVFAALILDQIYYIKLKKLNCHYNIAPVTNNNTTVTTVRFEEKTNKTLYSSISRKRPSDKRPLPLYDQNNNYRSVSLS